jgi:hypothetical protein
LTAAINFSTHNKATKKSKTPFKAVWTLLSWQIQTLILPSKHINSILITKLWLTFKVAINSRSRFTRVKSQ